MTDEERFILDLEGYLVIEGVLSAAEVTELNRIADTEFPHNDDGSVSGEWSMLPFGEPFKRLIDHPRLVPYLAELLGPTFRLDHDYCIFMKEGEKRGGLHGGQGGDHWYGYRNGEIRNGLSVMTYFLSDAPEGAGGFACVPGSHKSNLGIRELTDEVRNFERSVHFVRQPPVQAGDVLFFTEALMHGTMTWRAQTERRALLYKYSPGYSSWALDWYDFDRIGGLTERQQRILAPPSVQHHRSVVAEAD